MSGQEAREVRTTARQVNKRRQMMRLLLIIILFLLLLMSIVFAGASFLNKAGRFTVNLDPEALSKYNISISSTKDFKEPTVILQGTALENMWNITQDWILNDPNNREYYNAGDPTYTSFEEIDAIDGAHNGKDYIAYTFWIKNAGNENDESITYYCSLDINSAAKGADEAIRVMLFHNGVPTVYGKTPKNPDAQYANFGIDNYFVSADKVMETTRTGFMAGEMDRYTILIWLEGWDPECVDNIKGGEVKLSMNFKVLEEETSTG